MRKILSQWFTKHPKTKADVDYIRIKINNMLYRIHSTSYKKIELDKRYYVLFKTHIRWDKPERLTEKIQWNKIYGDSSNVQVQALLSDKYTVREWVAKRIGDEHLIPLIGRYKRFKDIDLNSLPDQFVIKCTHDSESTTLVKDKGNVEWRMLSMKYRNLLSRNFAAVSFERQYSLIKPQLVVEKYITNKDGDLPDYKFWCFNGIPYYCRVDMNRFGGGGSTKETFTIWTGIYSRGMKESMRTA